MLWSDFIRQKRSLYLCYSKCCIFGGIWLWETHRCFFCSPGDKETKLCAREAGSVPLGYIKALGVQLLSQPPLSPSEQELGRCLRLLWIEVFPKCWPSPWEGFSHLAFLVVCEQEHLEPFRIRAQRRVDVLACCSPDMLMGVWEGAWLKCRTACLPAWARLFLKFYYLCVFKCICLNKKKPNIRIAVFSKRAK